MLLEEEHSLLRANDVCRLFIWICFMLFPCWILSVVVVVVVVVGVVVVVVAVTIVLIVSCPFLLGYIFVFLPFCYVCFFIFTSHITRSGPMKTWTSWVIMSQWGVSGSINLTQITRISTVEPSRFPKIWGRVQNRSAFWYFSLFCSDTGTGD